MAEMFDFERYWQEKFSRCLDAAVGEENRRYVIQGGDALSSKSSEDEIIAWSKDAMTRLEVVADPETQKEIMLGCACRYPVEDLSEIRSRYESGGDLLEVHAMLQAQFEGFLRENLNLNESTVQEVLALGWGLAGVLEGNSVIATKIPKSGYLEAYMNEKDVEKRREMYCHCPRVRAVLKTTDTLPPIYCYCGAGFYKGIWEEILQESVEIEVLETVMQGGNVCKFEITLPHR